MSTDKTTPLLSQITDPLPPLQAAEAITRKVAEVGFDWPSTDGVIIKIKEELAELSHEINQNSDKSRLLDEMGDLLFACVNLARHLDVDPEQALAHANSKFQSRFNSVEAKAFAKGKNLAECSLLELDQLWLEVKRESKS